MGRVVADLSVMPSLASGMYNVWLLAWFMLPDLKTQTLELFKAPG